MVHNIIDEVIASSKGSLDRQRYIQQMHIFGKLQFVNNLLTANRFTISEIANFAGVTEDFVEEVKASVK